MRQTSKAMLCPVRYCGRLVGAALPLPVPSSAYFDTKKYCSQRCAESHSRGETRTPTNPLITCDICVEDKSLTDYVHKIREHGVGTANWNIPIPSGCLSHLAPELLDLESGVCADCLQSHTLTQFETRGAVNVSCILSHPPVRNQGRSAFVSQNWLHYAHHFLPLDRHDAYFQQLFDHYIHSTNSTLWTCPSNCGYGNGILQPNDTPGFPHVECPGCNDRFCANCKVVWHTNQTCQEYRAAHPEVHDEDEVKQLHEMVRLGARRCPRCQYIIIKDGGCNHVSCEQCHMDFLWPQAERVTAPVETYIPAPATSSSGTTFRGWSHLRQAQEAYLTRNEIPDTPFAISNVTHNPHDNRIFHFDFETGLWSSERCELADLAGRAAGQRFIRAPAHDRNGQLAFELVDEGEEGDIDLSTALERAIHAEATNPWDNTDEAFDDFPDDDSTEDWGNEDDVADTAIFGSPEFAAVERFMNHFRSNIQPINDPLAHDESTAHTDHAHVPPPTGAMVALGLGLGVAIRAPAGHPAVQMHGGDVALTVDELIDRMLGLLD